MASTVLIENALLWHALGCTRFSAQLMAERPFDFPITDWHALDTRVCRTLTDLGYMPHQHRPIVLHHHVLSGLCTCCQEHESYPVDGEGRYRG